jgi:hypothetical protein
MSDPTGGARERIVESSWEGGAPERSVIRMEGAGAASSIDQGSASLGGQNIESSHPEEEVKDAWVA